MRFASKIARVATAVALGASLLAGLAVPASARAADVMGKDQAGDAYLKAVCIGNDASAVFAKRVWHGRRHIYAPEVRRRLPELRRLSGRYAYELQREARLLFNPPADWPTDVADLVKRVATVSAKDSYFRQRQASAGTARAWLRFNGKSNDLSPGTAPAEIRAILDLPQPGKGC